MRNNHAFVFLCVICFITSVTLFSCGSSSDHLDNQFRKGPYLVYPGNNTSMTVMWQTYETPVRSTIEWGYTEHYGEGKATIFENDTGKDGHQFSYTIKGLPHNTRIYYRVTVGGQFYTSSFKTAPSDSDTSLSFYAYGDTIYQPDIHNRVVAQLMKDLTRDPDKYQTFCLQAGDYVMYGLDQTNWDIEYFNSGMRLFLSFLPVIGAIGDHEALHPGSFIVDHEHAGDLFRKYWPNPLFSDSSHFYYSFDYGQVHIVALDQYTTDYNKGSAQYNWLEQDLANTNNRWKIVMFHEPAWSAYGFPDPETYPHENNEIVQKDLTPLFEKYGVKVVIQGHNHYYARCEVNGIQYLTLGGGGAITYPPDTNYINVVKAVEDYHFSRFDISGKTMTVSAINIEGDLIDTFTVSEEFPEALVN